MAYLANSIERCAPIVGYDPYAFIMDKPSNLQINKMQSPYDVDYYAVGPQNADPDVQNTGEKKKKKTGLLNGLKIAAALVTAGAIVYGILRCNKKTSQLLKKAGTFTGEKFHAVKEQCGKILRNVKDRFKNCHKK